MKPKSTALALTLLLAAGTPSLQGYAEDSRAGGDPHSTFHYNLVRTLARAAGWSAEDAQKIAVACEATDRGTFGGITLTGTERPDVHQGQQTTGLYYHFGRRGTKNATGAYTQPGEKGGTCQYFERAHVAAKDFSASCPLAYLAKTPAGVAGQPGPCQVNDRGETVPEVSEIELWAVYGRGLPRFGAPEIAVGDEPAAPVAGKSLDALGIYLHALADSYSHEACMQQCSFQGHSVAPPACTAAYWHEIAEYGPLSLQNSGVHYTRDGGRAVWKALLHFREVNSIAGAPLWSDEQAAAFIEKWAALDTTEEREKAADEAFAALGG